MFSPYAAQREPHDHEPLTPFADSYQTLTGLLSLTETRNHLVAHGVKVRKAARGIHLRLRGVHGTLGRLAAHIPRPRGASPGDIEGNRQLDLAFNALSEELLRRSQQGRDPTWEIKLPMAERHASRGTAALSPDDGGLLNHRTYLCLLDLFLPGLKGSNAPLVNILIPLLTDTRISGAVCRILVGAKATHTIPYLKRRLGHCKETRERLHIVRTLILLGERAFSIRTWQALLLYGRPEDSDLVIADMRALCELEDAPLVQAIIPLVCPRDGRQLASILCTLDKARGTTVLLQAVAELDATTPPKEAESILRTASTLNSRALALGLMAYSKREERPWFKHRARQLVTEQLDTEIPELAIEQLLDEARAALETGDQPRAHHALEEASSHHANDFLFFYLLAHCLQRMDDPLRALDAIENAVRRSPSSWQAHRLRGCLLWDISCPIEALDAYDRSIHHNPDDATTWYYRGFSLTRMRRFSEAIASLDRSLKLNPEAAHVHAERGLCLEGLERHAESVAAYRRSLALNPEAVDIKDMLGQALHHVGMQDEALTVFDALITSHPNRWETRYNRADLLYDMEQWREAERDFSRYLSHRDTNYFAWHNRGLCLRFMGNHAEAEECFENALRLHPESAETQHQLAWCQAAET